MHGSRLTYRRCLRAARCLVLLIAMAAINSAVSAADDPDWSPGTFTLDNGLDVVVLPDHRVPVVTHMMWYRVGSADEPPGRSGIAHFLEHLMFKGTKAVPPGELSKIVARNGGQDNAFTSYDYTAYFQRVALDRLPLVMELEADRMTNLVLTDEVIAPERDVVLEERSSRIDNDPERLLGEQMSATLYMSHPYRIPVIGWAHEIRSLTTEDALEFYRRYYAPNNAILIVAGDITADELRPLAEKFYGAIPPVEHIGTRLRPKEPPAVAPRRIDYRDPRVKQSSLQRHYLAPSSATAAPGEAEAMDVLAEILGVGPTSRLYRALVVEKAIATSAGAFYSSDGLDYGRFAVYGTPRSGVSLEDLETGVDAVIAEILAGGVSQEELDRAKANLIADTVYARDNQRSLAQDYGVGLTTGKSVDDVTRYPERVGEVTGEAVLEAARRILDSPAHVTGYLRSAEAS